MIASLEIAFQERSNLRIRKTSSICRRQVRPTISATKPWDVKPLRAAAEVRAQEATEKLQALTSSLTAARAQSQDLREDLARAMARARPKAPFVPKGLYADAIAERLNSTRL